MRASHMQANVACLATLPEASAIRRACSSLIEPVEAALRISWLPLELNTALIEEVERTCGHEAARGWIQASLQQSMKSTLLKPVVDAVTYLGLGAPQHGLKRCAYGWDLIYKGAGRVECIHASAGEAKILLSEPAAKVRSPSYLRAVASAFEGFVLGTGGHEPETEIKDGPRIEFSLRWSARP